MIDNPSVYLIKLQNNATGTWVHESTICHTVYRLGFTRKKLQHVSFGRSEDLRARFIADASLFDPHMFLRVGESGFRQRNSIRSYGYSLRGMRAKGHQLKLGRISVNAIAVMSHEGVNDILN